MPSPTSLVGPDGECAVGSFFKSGSATLAEVLGYTDLDFLLVDRQHASPDLETVEHIVRAADLNDLPVFIRLPTDNLDLVVTVLDAGVSGLVVPQVESEAQIRDVIDATRFTDDRSYAMSTRAGKFGNRNREEYLDWVATELAVVPMIETKAGLDAAPDIAAIDGVSALMAGPADMAFSLAVDRGSHEHLEAIDQVQAHANDASIGFGKYVSSMDALDEALGEYSFVVYHSDTGLLTQLFADVL